MSGPRSARYLRGGILARNEFEIMEQNTPWKTERAECLTCGHRWMAVLMLGDVVEGPCPFCEGPHVELEGEAPLFIPVQH